MGRIGLVVVFVVLAVVVVAAVFGCQKGAPAWTTIDPDCPAQEEKERIFLFGLRASLDSLYDLYARLAALVRATATNPNLISSERWVDQIVEVLGGMGAEAEYLRTLDPPKAASYLMARPMLVAAAIDRMSDFFVTGITYGDQGSLNNARFEVVFIEGNLNSSWSGLQSYCRRQAEQYQPLQVPGG